MIYTTLVTLCFVYMTEGSVTTAQLDMPSPATEAGPSQIPIGAVTDIAPPAPTEEFSTADFEDVPVAPAKTLVPMAVEPMTVDEIPAAPVEAFVPTVVEETPVAPKEEFITDPMVEVTVTPKEELIADPQVEDVETAKEPDPAILTTVKSKPKKPEAVEPTLVDKPQTETLPTPSDVKTAAPKNVATPAAKSVVTVTPKKVPTPLLPIKVAPEATEPTASPAEVLKIPESKMPIARTDHSILGLQPFSQSYASTYKRGGTDYQVTLRHLNPSANMWFLLSSSHLKGVTFHLENIDSQQKVELAPGDSGQLRLVSRSGVSECNVFDEAVQKKIKKERDDNRSYTSICGDRLYVRNPLEGRQTAKEFVAEFLRDNIWGGEEITTLVKETIYKDKFLLTADTQQSSGIKAARREGPRAALLKKGQEQASLQPKELGIVLETKDDKLGAGQWYDSKAQKGVYVSLYRADLTPEKIMQSYSSRVGKLDSVESKALVISVALDMNQFELGFGIGTDHPRVNWSERIPEDRIPDGTPGPDGFDTIAPLVGTGKVAPHLRSSIIATFAAGFKRSHAAFKWGALSKINNASHYGWMEQGTLFSRLQPGLSTISVDQNGGFDIRTWTDQDNVTFLPKLRHARQNGVPIIDGMDAQSGLPKPGSLVNRWGAGNWSGSIDSKQRTLRAALCHQKTSQGDFLIYSYFSTATPSAMARVFQAYHCEYAIHLDMNALEHTYFATYFQNGKDFRIEHLNTGMGVLDSKHKGEALPRFVGQADNRDYFYIKRKEFSH